MSYGSLGEIVREVRTLVSPATGEGPREYATEYLYDSFGRLQALVYPDGEALRYGYNAGGQVESAVGVKAGVATPYLRYLGYDKFEQRVRLESGNGVVTDYSYRADNRRLARLVAGAHGAAPFQNLAYTYDRVGNITGLSNQVAVPKPGGYGGPVTQTFDYDDLDRLTSASGEWTYAPNKRESYELALRYDAIHNITHKTQQHLAVPPSGKALVQKKTSYDWRYQYQGAQPHAPTQIGTRHFRYDANGNQTGWTSDANGTRRSLVWDEENRIRSVADNGRTQRYVYDASGERVFKWTAQGETAYVSRYFTVRNGTLATKHVFVGSTRLSSTLVPGLAHLAPGSHTVGSSGNQAAQSALRNPHFNSKFGGAHPGLGRVNRSAQGAANAQDVHKNPHLVDGANPPPAEPPPPGTPPGPGTPGAEQPEGNFRYYYHPDHLGSSSYITDGAGELYEHLQYFPFGETWVEQASNRWRTPYRFTGKELDEETGLYYFGARYYDPRTSVWQSADPIFGQYLDGEPQGGVYRPSSLGLYTYTYNNPIIYVDPDGKVGLLGAAVGAVAGLVVQGGMDLYHGRLSSLGSYAGAATGGAIVGATAGLGSGLAGGAIAVGSGAVGGTTSVVTQAVVDGQELTAGNLVEGAAYGAAGGGLGQAAGKVIQHGLNNLSPAAKGTIGELVTEGKYLSQGYVSQGKAVVPTGGKTATGRVQAAHYDHDMRNVFTGNRLTIESKFNSSSLTGNQRAAQGNVVTPGGLIIDRTTSGQLGNTVNTVVRGAAVGANE